MNKKQLFAFFRQQDIPVLLRFLDAAYEAMSTDQRAAVFGKAIPKAKPLQVDGPSLLTQVTQFQRDSLAGKYYAPFDISSKNSMHIPKETNAWFHRLGDLLTDSARPSNASMELSAKAMPPPIWCLEEESCSTRTRSFACVIRHPASRWPDRAFFQMSLTGYTPIPDRMLRGTTLHLRRSLERQRQNRGELAKLV